MKYKELYKMSRDYAREYDEIPEWRESHRENRACAKAITNAIRDNYYDNSLHDCFEPIVDKYGIDRVKWVLANTIQDAMHDGRYSNSNKEWAVGIGVPKDDNRFDFIVTAHPVLVNAFTDDVRNAFPEQLDESDDEAESFGKGMKL